MMQISSLKKIGFFIALTLATACSAAEPAPAGKLALGAFEVAEVNDLGHPVCSLQLPENKKEDFFNYVEGDICPVGGGDCAYSAIIKLNGKLAVLKRVNTKGKTASYENAGLSIQVTHAPQKCRTKQGCDEGLPTKSNLTIKANGQEQKFNMQGYCGV